MAQSTSLKILFGDLVELKWPNGRMICRVFGKTTSNYGAQRRNPLVTSTTRFIVKPDSSGEYVAVNDPDLGHMNVMTAPKLEWGSIPARPWLIAPGVQLVQMVSKEMGENFKKQGLCPRCGDPGFWKQLGCFCKYHGQFMG